MCLQKFKIKFKTILKQRRVNKSNADFNLTYLTKFGESGLKYKQIKVDKSLTQNDYYDQENSMNYNPISRCSFFNDLLFFSKKGNINIQIKNYLIVI